MTADAGAGLDSPAREREVLSDRLGDAVAIILVELPPETADYVQAFHEAKSDRKAEIVFGGERHGGSLSVARRGPIVGRIQNRQPIVKCTATNEGESGARLPSTYTKVAWLPPAKGRTLIAAAPMDYAPPRDLLRGGA